LYAKLTTIADLDQPAEVTKPLIARAMELGKFYTGFKAQDTGGYQYLVDVTGSKDRAPGIHASELSCQLKLVYNLLGVEKRPENRDVNMQMRFNMGHAVHGMVQHEFKLMCQWLGGGITFEDEVGIHPGLGGVAAQYTMYSSADGVFCFVHDGVVYLRVGLEIKTESGPGFEKLKKPRDYHDEQTCMYMKALDLPLLWTFYYNKSNSNIVPSTPPWLNQFDHHLWTATIEPKIAGAHEFARARQLPPRTEGFYCTWCPFAWTCKPPRMQRKTYGPSHTVHQPGALRR
jgi:hypothetical protein